MKNKGFTLVELLAVITILAIISIIAVPIVLNLIEDLKIKSYDNSVENVMKAAKIYDLQSELTDEQALMDQNIYEEVKKNLSGNKPEDGTIYIKASNISETREIAFALQYGDWCYTKAYGEKTYTKTKTNECIVPMDYLMATHDNYPTTDIFLNNPFNITRESIERVITVPTNEVPEALKDNSWDVSVDKTGEIIAWYEKYQNENGEDRYTIYIGQEGGVKANSSSGFLFQNLINAEEIDLTYFDTSSVTYMGYMFAYCSSLTRLDVSKFDTSKVTSMTSMFRYCGKLISLDVGNFDTRDVTNISEMFYGCSSLNSLDVSNWNTENVTNMYAMFHRCSKVTTLDVSNWNTENVTDMSWMFSSCSNLTELYVSNFVTNRVTSMLSMFEGCSGLTELDVSNFVTDNVDNMYRMFGYCSSLTELDLSNFVTKKVTNMYGMFEECSSLTKLYLSNFDVSNVTNLSYMFKGCNSIEKIYVNKLWTFKEGADTTNIYGTGTTGESTVDWFEVVSTS